jgi:hypothetical protein
MLYVVTVSPQSIMKSDLGLISMHAVIGFAYNLLSKWDVFEREEGATIIRPG